MILAIIDKPRLSIPQQCLKNMSRLFEALCNYILPRVFMARKNIPISIHVCHGVFLLSTENDPNLHINICANIHAQNDTKNTKYKKVIRKILEL